MTTRIQVLPVKILTVALLLASLISVSTVSAQEIDMTLSNDSAQFRYITHSNAGFGDSEIDFGVLYTNSDEVMGMLGLMVVDDAGSGSPGLKVGLGIKAFTVSATKAGDFDAAALSLGAELNYTLPGFSDRLALNGQIFYAPDIVSFMDANRYMYSTARIEYEVLPQAVVYLGYRRVRIGLSAMPSVTLDSDTHLGVQFYF